MDKLEASAFMQSATSIGPQANSKVTNQPVFSFVKETRDGREKVFLSKKHPQDLLGKDSPGPLYTPKRQAHPPQFGFGSSAARPMLGGPRYPEPSNDLIGVTLKNTSLSKYKSQPSMCIGASTRQAEVNAPDMCSFAMGRESPGPMRYKSEVVNGAYRFAHAPTVDQSAPAYTIRQKTKQPGVKDTGDTPAKVGPGAYKINGGCGEQLLSTKASLPQWSVHKMDRFQKSERDRFDAGRLWDGGGDKKLKFNRTFSASPSAGFGTSTRAAAQRFQIVRTNLDRVC